MELELDWVEELELALEVLVERLIVLVDSNEELRLLDLLLEERADELEEDDDPLHIPNAD